MPFIANMQLGAAVLGVRVKPTIKEVHSDLTVVKTLKRVNLWEVQTPQVISLLDFSDCAIESLRTPVLCKLVDNDRAACVRWPWDMFQWKMCRSVPIACCAIVVSRL